MHFDGRGITVADASRRRRISRTRRRTKIEEMMRRDGREEGRRSTCRSRSIIYSRAHAARGLAMRTCTAYVVITSSHLHRSRTRIFAIDKKRAPRRDAADPFSPSRSVSIAVGPGPFFFGRGRRSPLILLVAAIRRGLLRVPRPRRDIGE